MGKAGKKNIAFYKQVTMKRLVCLEITESGAVPSAACRFEHENEKNRLAANGEILR